MPSFQAKILKPLLKYGMRHSFKSVAQLPKERIRTEQRDRMALRMDRDFSRRDQLLGSVPSQWITTPGSDPDRLILYFHGGGFCVRTPAVHGQLLAKLCAGSGTTGLMPDYRLAPEHPFPAAYEDGLEVYRWLLNAGYAPEKIVFAGDSAGGALVIGTLLGARDEGLPMPACALMFSPGLGALHKPDVLKGIKEGPVLSFQSMQVFGEAIAVKDHLDHPLALLINQDFKGLPPLLFQAGSDEILLQDSIEGAARAEAAGVEVQLEVFEGMMHVFQIFGMLPESRRALAQAVTFIRTHLDDGRLKEVK
jgi:acetyl esterase/lipase